MQKTITARLYNKFNDNTCRKGTVLKLDIVRETKKHFLTEELFSFGIQDLSNRYRKLKLVRWNKETGLREGSTPCFYTPDYCIQEEKLDQ